MNKMSRTLAVAAVACCAAAFVLSAVAAERVDFTDLNLEDLMATTVTSASKFVHPKNRSYPIPFA